MLNINPTAQVFIQSEKRIVVTIITLHGFGKFTGIAKCSEEDTFDEDFGSQLSYQRANRKMTRALKNHFRQQIEFIMAQEIKPLQENLDACMREINKSSHRIDNLISRTYPNTEEAQ